MQFYFVVLKMLGFKDSDSNIIIILKHENRPVVWSGPYILCCNYLTMGKRELVALLNLSSLCLVVVEWLFLAVPWGRLRFVIVVFPDHTHLLILMLVILGVQKLRIFLKKIKALLQF